VRGHEGTYLLKHCEDNGRIPVYYVTDVSEKQKHAK
jgi:hypothetical protein